MRNPKMTLLFLLSCLTLLSGCEKKTPCIPKTVTEAQKVKHDIPADFLDCPEIPTPPEMIDQGEASAFMVMLRHVAIECKKDVESVKKMVQK